MKHRQNAALPTLFVDEGAPDYASCQALVEALLAWFSRAGRALPWRKQYEPYAVWVSEIMLQQTQMERAVGYFERWMQRFPTLEALARANDDEALKAWEGLGYYSRVRNMQKTARIVMQEYGGQLPRDFALLRALPGIGDYTAGAVLSIAFNEPYPAVDANVERVFARLFDVEAPVKSRAAAGFIKHMAEALLPPGRARQFNEALMEFGALVCGKKPKCEGCALAAFCQARRLGIVHERPVPGKRTAYTELSIVTGLLVHEGRIFVQKRLDTGVWAGFWEFPGGRIEEGESPEQAVCREFFEETEFRVRPVDYLGLVRHGYTRYKIAMHCFVCSFVPTAPQTIPVLHAATEYRWLLPQELDALTLPAGHRKLVDAWLPSVMARI